MTFPPSLTSLAWYANGIDVIFYILTAFVQTFPPAKAVQAGLAILLDVRAFSSQSKAPYVLIEPGGKGRNILP